jgi:hypothetical protein
MPENTAMDWSPQAWLAIKVNAGHDTNGNPRRGWAAINCRSGDMVDFVDEGYTGRASLTRKYPRAVEGPVFQVTPGEYRDLKKFGRELDKKKPNLGRGKTMAKKKGVPPVLMAWVHCRKESGVRPGVKMSARQKTEAKSCVVRQMRKMGK